MAVAGSTTATRVYGQSGAFTTTDSPNPPTATSLNNPNGVAVDAQGGLFIADSNNHRVLYFVAGASDGELTTLYLPRCERTTRCNTNVAALAVNLVVYTIHTVE